MRVRRLTLAAIFLVGWPGAVTGFGQAPVPAPPVPANEAPVSVIDDVKLIAQRAAIAHLSGERPFILRESSWSGVIDPGKARLIQVQLFKRNDYHFWFAVPDRKAGLNLNIYNGKGEVVETENLAYDATNVVSLIVRPEETGVYYLRISLHTTITTPQKWSVIYAYR